MPELPEVETSVRVYRPIWLGKLLNKSSFVSQSYVGR